MDYIRILTTTLETEHEKNKGNSNMTNGDISMKIVMEKVIIDRDGSKHPIPKR